MNRPLSAQPIPNYTFFRNNQELFDLRPFGFRNILRSHFCTVLTGPCQLGSATVAIKSALHAEVTSKAILQVGTQKMHGYDIPALLIADSVYPFYFGF